MKGDFTRDTFDATKHFSRVLMQQGRVTLDADHNEQVGILLHYIRTLARDLIGPYGAPAEHPGFVLDGDSEGIIIGAGRYYVDGILIENNNPCRYHEQDDYPLPDGDVVLASDKEQNAFYWFYLDTWERLITYVDDPSIREKALNGPDTCARAKTIWQVKALALPEIVANFEKRKEQLQTEEGNADLIAKLDQVITDLSSLAGGSLDVPAETCAAPLELLNGMGSATLRARVDPGEISDSPCAVAPDSKYRGSENHLYRVEIHQGGVASEATLKWSRENGSVVTALLGIEGQGLKVASTRGFTATDWVEISHEAQELRGERGTLVKVAKVDTGVLTIDPAQAVPAFDPSWINPKIRRWDQTGVAVSSDGTLPVASGVGPEWLTLEDGVQVQFSSTGVYRSGDYWWIPARVATGAVEWPTTMEDDKIVPASQKPHGVQHHFAPLGFMIWSDGFFSPHLVCNCSFTPGSSCYDPNAPVVNNAPAPTKGRRRSPVPKPAAAAAGSRSRRKPAK